MCKWNLVTIRKTDRAGQVIAAETGDAYYELFTPFGPPVWPRHRKGLREKF